jgi:hypothetical protein
MYVWSTFSMQLPAITAPSPLIATAVQSASPGADEGNGATSPALQRNAERWLGPISTSTTNLPMAWRPSALTPVASLYGRPSEKTPVSGQRTAS